MNRRRIIHLGSCAVGGAAYAVGHVGFGVWPLLLVCLVPLWRTIAPRWHHSIGFCAACGFAFGATVYIVGYGWLWSLVEGFLAGQRTMAVALWLAHGIWIAAGFAVHAGIGAALARSGCRLWAATVPSIVAVQWLQPQLFSASLGEGLVHAPGLAQTAELGGPMLLTAWVATVNATAAALWSWREAERPFPKTIALVAIAWTAFAVAFAGLRASSPWPSSATPLRVGIVQANLSPSADATERLHAHRTYLELSRSLINQSPVDLLVWPESAYGPTLRLPLPIAGHGIRRDLGVPLLFGGSSIERNDRARVVSNAAFLIGHDGLIQNVYRKRLLIPFAEYIPAETALPWLRDWLPNTQRFTASQKSEPLSFRDWRMVTPICYEAVHPSYVRRVVIESRPHFIVTLANDAWFGASQEPWIHLQLTRLRAIEHRRWIVRSTNSGISAVINPNGHIVDQTPLLAPATLATPVYASAGLTLYARFGDWPGVAACLLLVFCALAPLRRRLRRPQ